GAVRPTVADAIPVTRTVVTASVVARVLVGARVLVTRLVGRQLGQALRQPQLDLLGERSPQPALTEPVGDVPERRAGDRDAGVVGHRPLTGQDYADVIGRVPLRDLHGRPDDLGVAAVSDRDGAVLLLPTGHRVNDR